MTKKIHLGCGEKRLPGFINIDSRASPFTDMVCDMNDLPFKQGSIEIIYMCHSLEHIPMYSIVSLLSKLKSLLMPSGKLYISVPDFEILSSIYLAQKVKLATIVRAIHGGQEYPQNTHYMSYDYELLSTILLGAGFGDVNYYSPKDFLPKEFEDTSTYEIAGKRISLNVVASK